MVMSFSKLTNLMRFLCFCLHLGYITTSYYILTKPLLTQALGAFQSSWKILKDILIEMFSAYTLYSKSQHATCFSGSSNVRGGRCFPQHSLMEIPNVFSPTSRSLKLRLERHFYAIKTHGGWIVFIPILVYQN